MKKKGTVKIHDKPQTVLETFAKFISKNAPERDEKFEVVESENCLVIMRHKE